MSDRATDGPTIAARIERAEIKRARIRSRNSLLPCGAPVWPAERREALREARWKALAASHGHETGDACKDCVATGERMEMRATA